MKLQLPNVTIVGIDCVNVERLVEAMNVSEKEIVFGASKLLTSLPSDDTRRIQIPHLDSVQKYSDFCIKNLASYIDTEYALIVQHDGFILNPTSWEDAFIDYDYIGAPWDISDWSSETFKIPEELIGQEIVGNGGFCIRSKKFLELSQKFYNEGKITKTHPEDVALCVWYRSLFEKEGMRFAPVDIARRFSLEGTDLVYDKQFGFHGFSWTKIDKWILENQDNKLIVEAYTKAWAKS